MRLSDQVIVRSLGQQDYHTCWQAMRDFTQNRNETTPDEIWLLEHKPVFTQGQNGKPEHILNPGTIPVIKVDRGGQVTYHGPGQLIAYTLIDLKRKKFNVRDMVSALENAVILSLADFQIEARARCEAPGVYVAYKKICSVGLRIRRGCSYHGLALNVSMDLDPFLRINPCGFRELEMAQMKNYHMAIDIKLVEITLTNHLVTILGYNHVDRSNTPHDRT